MKELQEYRGYYVTETGKVYSSKTNQYSLERFIATLDLLRRKSEIKLKNI